MARKTSPLNQIIGIALIVLGIGLVIWGYQLSQSISSQMYRSLSGSLPDKEMTFFIGGAISFVIGSFLAFRR